MIEKATEILQMGIDTEWEKIIAQIRRCALNGETEFNVTPGSGAGCGLSFALNRCEMFIEQLLDAGYDLTLKKDTNYKKEEFRKIVKISWGKALPGRKGEVEYTDR